MTEDPIFRKDTSEKQSASRRSATLEWQTDSGWSWDDFLVHVLPWTNNGLYGAPPHTANISLMWFENHFGDRVISEKMNHPWAPHFPAETPRLLMCGDIYRDSCTKNDLTILMMSVAHFERRVHSCPSRKDITSSTFCDWLIRWSWLKASKHGLIHTFCKTFMNKCYCEVFDWETSFSGLLHSF